MDSYSVVTSGLQAGEPRCTCVPMSFCTAHGDNRPLPAPARLTAAEKRWLEERLLHG